MKPMLALESIGLIVLGLILFALIAIWMCNRSEGLCESAGCLASAVLTRGLVSSGLDPTGAERGSSFTYRGFFSHVKLALAPE